MKYSKEKIDCLRQKVAERMSPKRFFHTAEVEKMAQRIGEIYAPDKLDILRVAALLHDITKEKSSVEQLELLKANGVEVTAFDEMSPKTLHARTAEFVIKSDFPDFYDDEVIECIRFHTTGDPQMSVCSMIIYLADYIDMSRTFEDCIKLRSYFWDNEVSKMTQDERYMHLLKTLVLSFDMTLSSLILEGAPISINTLNTRNEFICRLAK